MEKTDQELLQLIKDANGIIADAQADLVEFKGELAKRLKGEFDKFLKRSGAEHGKTTLPFGGGFVVTEIRRTIKWDTDKLMVLANGMSAEESDRIFMVSLKVPEKNLKAGGPISIDLMPAILEARETTYSELSVKLADESE